MEIPFEWSPQENGPAYSLQAACIGTPGHWRAAILNSDGTYSLCDDSRVNPISQIELRKLLSKNPSVLAYTA